MALSLFLSNSSTLMDKYLCAAVDKCRNFEFTVYQVHKSEIKADLSTSYTHADEMDESLFYQVVKKKVDHLSPYPRCLLLLLFKKMKFYRII